ncbi:MAG: DUF1189 domain-containing protein [Candidatus Obscuribacterales bacterium]|nr:DUF1189 domain-containing protein [Candidatus Obscuribacterales bacterium]
MKTFECWQAPVFAFFSTGFYRQLGSASKGLGFLYMLVLIAVSSAVIPVKEFLSFQTMFTSHGHEVIEQIPDLKIEHGRLSINQPLPYYISDPQSGAYLIAFDSTENGESSQLDIPLIITPEGFSSRGGQGQSAHVFKSIEHLSVSASELQRWMTIGLYLVPLATYLFALPLIWLGHIVQALGFSLAGLILAKMISVKIKYAGILRISSYALGNVILLDGFMNIFPLEVPGLGTMLIALPGWALYKFFLALGYTLFGVGANLSAPGFRSVSEPGEPEGESKSGER